MEYVQPFVISEVALNESQQVVLLVVEDDRAMRSLLCDELWDLGVRIVEAADGDEAVQKLADSQPDLILTGPADAGRGVGLCRPAQNSCAVLPHRPDDRVWGCQNEGRSPTERRSRLFRQTGADGRPQSHHQTIVEQPQGGKRVASRQAHELTKSRTHVRRAGLRRVSS